MELSQKRKANNLIHVLDDDGVISEILEEMITDLGYRVAAFEDPNDYLAHMHLAGYEKPLAIITDVNMPTMNGYVFITRIREFFPKQKFIVLTGSPEFNHTSKDSACFYLCKPFRGPMLEEILKALTHCNQCCVEETVNIIDDREAFSITRWTCPFESAG